MQFFFLREVNKLDVQTTIEKYSNKRFINGLNVSSINNNESNVIIQSVEVTSCEDYDIVQNIFHKLIREIKRDRETIKYMTCQLQINDDVNNNNNNNNLKTLKTLKTNLNYSKSRSKSPRQANNINISQNEIVNMINNNNVNIENNINNVESTNNSQSIPNIIANNSNSAKKQSSSKFPFFTKILNKS